MALYRSISRDFFSDADIVEVSHSARLLFQAMELEADREGRFVFDLRTINIRYFPRDSFDIGAAAKDLMVAGLIVAYSDESLSLAYIPKFSHFQAINGREAQSKLPAPPRVVTRQVVSARDGTGEEAHAVMECSERRVASCGPSPSQAADVYTECVHSGRAAQKIGSNPNGGDDDF
jgi:hypothetical protein